MDPFKILFDNSIYWNTQTLKTNKLKWIILLLTTILFHIPVMILKNGKTIILIIVKD